VKTNVDTVIFFSVTELSRITDFLDAICREMNLRGKVFKFFDTLYIGGGTPSVLRRIN
jgi:coproporphyrinogen III oxidase-like Fe-S oxidoreductase